MSQEQTHSRNEHLLVILAEKANSQTKHKGITYLFSLKTKSNFSLFALLLPNLSILLYLARGYGQRRAPEFTAWWGVKLSFLGALALFLERELFLTLVSSTRAQKAGRSGIPYPCAVFETGPYFPFFGLSCEERSKSSSWICQRRNSFGIDDT